MGIFCWKGERVEDDRMKDMRIILLTYLYRLRERLFWLVAETLLFSCSHLIDDSDDVL